MTTTDTLVIGAGQAGLAAAHHLGRAGTASVILDASASPAGSWPRYYDSLGSSPVVGSSTKRICGSTISATERSSRLRMPPEYALTRFDPVSASPNCSSNSWARRRAARIGSLLSRPNIIRFCRPDISSSTAAYWPTSPIRRRTCRPSRTTS
ncbi:MAG: NAD(P)-binding protein [Propionibacterium sp.]|nr:NAD(P)-binding protein [Propionibacterium sp.]